MWPESATGQHLIGESPVLMDLMEHVGQLALLSKPALILGERGSGKELIAERLHYLSPRWSAPFIKLNCASMNEQLLETELFGHESGAFTGASRQHKGRFERADGGTLFLDELATCSLRVQEKLLRVIEYGEIERVGGHRTLQVDVRVVAATNADLTQMAVNGHFRADLLDRLAFDVLHVPPLRVRGDDLLLLADTFAITMCQSLDRPFFPGFTEHAQQVLKRHDWPGNIRELKNVIERSIYRWQHPELPVDTIVLNPFVKPWQELPHAGSDTETDRDLKTEKLSLPEEVARLERQRVEEALIREAYNQQRAAASLGISYHQLRAQLRKHQMLPLKQYRAKKAGR